MENMRVSAKISLIVYGGTCPVIFTQDTSIEITPKVINQIRHGVIKVGGVQCTIRDYFEVANHCIASATIHGLEQKELDQYVKNGWIFNEENAKKHYLPQK
jgi:hypothetical protein